MAGNARFSLTCKTDAYILLTAMHMPAPFCSHVWQLTFMLNARELPLDHGFPVRIVAPGITGARSVKWLSRIIASPEESGSHWQQVAYLDHSHLICQ